MVTTILLLAALLGVLWNSLAPVRDMPVQCWIDDERIVKNAYVTNFTVGRAGHQVNGVVFHRIEGYVSYMRETLILDPTDGVSAHFSLARDGTIEQHVSLCDTAYHAGIPASDATWSGLQRNVFPNYHTVGVEMEDGDEWREVSPSWNPEIIDAMIYLTHKIWESGIIDVPIDTESIVGHNMVRGSIRYSCPGQDWYAYARPQIIESLFVK